MKQKTSLYAFLWLALATVILMFALTQVGTRMSLAQISILPTQTWTPQPGSTSTPTPTFTPTPVATPLPTGYDPCLVKAFHYDFGLGNLYDLTPIGDRIVFVAAAGSGSWVWTTDGTSAGTTLLTDSVTGSAMRAPAELTVVGDRLFFLTGVTDLPAPSGRKLWVTNGTSAGTTLVKDFFESIETGQSYTRNLAAVGDRLFLMTGDGTDYLKLWVSDGTEAGTVVIKDLEAGVPLFETVSYVTYNGLLFFVGGEKTLGGELWVTDGTAAGTTMVKDIDPGSWSSWPKYLTVFNGLLYFSASDGSYGRELWVTDGTEAGTTLLVDINPGFGSSNPEELVVLGNRLFFRATNDSIQNEELWVTDGTVAGTVLVKDINPGNWGSRPSDFAPLGGRLFFRANDGIYGDELWATDGTPEGTILVKDIYPGADSSGPRHLAAYDGRLFFAANDEFYAQGFWGELWMTDGTAQGTVLVKDLQLGWLGSEPAHFTLFGNQLVFGARDGIYTRNLWIIGPTCAPSPPVANDDSYGTTEDTPLDVSAAGVLSNDTDAEGNALTSVLDTMTNDGSLLFYSDGSFSYVPDTGFCGQDSFTYHTNDGTADSNVATVTIDVACINDPPALTADWPAIQVDEGELAVNTGTVSDPDGDTVALSTTVGTVTNNNDGTWSWTFFTGDGPTESQTVTISADDGNGGSDQISFVLTVENVAPEVGSIIAPLTPQAVDASISARAVFTDPGTADTHIATWSWGDGSSSTGTVGAGSVGPDSHTYAQAGVYAVELIVIDDDGGVETITLEFVVVYDPTGGFVIGGGWIDSPAGAFVSDPALTGKATFGFVSKYKKGASTPTGNTEFQFRAADLNFHSAGYDWLVVNQGGTNAQFKGSGTINGTGDYRFMLWAGDGAPDTFRIRIWEEDGLGNETKIYDNSFGLAIGGGSIVIHAK